MTTETETPAAPAGEHEWKTEQWTFGGAVGTGKDARHIWYDEDRNKLRYTPDKGARYVVAGVYATPVRREPRADGEGDQTWRRSSVRYAGPQPDRDFAAKVEAEAYAAQIEIETERAENKHRRDPGVLDELVAPIERVAASMTYAQREALLALIARRVHRANLGRTR